jgi:hypothetical protein
MTRPASHVTARRFPGRESPSLLLARTMTKVCADEDRACRPKHLTRLDEAGVGVVDSECGMLYAVVCIDDASLVVLR